MGLFAVPSANPGVGVIKEGLLALYPNELTTAIYEDHNRLACTI
jgi:hypothetical protein